eukprot:12882585-Prorocentrum_lima.AAC.1
MIDSWWPEHSLDGQPSILKEEERIMMEKGRRLYPWCELDCRWKEWPLLSTKEMEACPDYCLYEQ